MFVLLLPAVPHGEMSRQSANVEQRSEGLQRVYVPAPRLRSSNKDSETGDEKMSYTKGEWHLDLLAGEVKVNGMRVAKVYGATELNHEEDSTECMMNARLILSAPTMLQTLRKTKSALETCRHCESLADEI